MYASRLPLVQKNEMEFAWNILTSFVSRQIQVYKKLVI